ncbi:hypothetical protein MASR1M32_17850 [Rhodobacter sp.]
MKRLVLALALGFPLAASAQETPAPDTGSGSSLMEEGAKLFLRGLMSEMEPALDDMAKALDEARPMLEDLGPQLAQLLEVMGDIRHYDKPLVLPNGDILIRRSPGAPPYKPAPAPAPSLPGPNGEIDL